MGRRNIDEPGPRPLKTVARQPEKAPRPVKTAARDKHSGSVCDSGQVADLPIYGPDFIGPPALEGYARTHFTRYGWRKQFEPDKFARLGKWGETGVQGIGEHGRILCLCGCGVEVRESKRHATKAKANCWETWAKVHDPGVVRRCVERRDKGVCAKCKRDTEAMKREITAAVSKKLGTGRIYSWAQRSAGIPSPEGFPDIDRHWWEANHVLAVVEGGGLCGLEGMETLCIPCHREHTAALAARRAAGRRPPSGECLLPLS